jgi:uncharacterized membrane protein YphA (DoxX/SURF4 family)
MQKQHEKSGNGHFLSRVSTIMQSHFLGGRFGYFASLPESGACICRNHCVALCKSIAMKQYHIVSRIAIYLLALVMIVFGIQHFRHAQDLAVYIPLWVPGGFFWVYLTGVAFILVGISFLFNRWVKIAAYVLAALLFIFVFIIHIPNVIDGGTAEVRASALVNLLKDTAIAGFALHIAAGAHHQKLHLEDSD